MQPREMGLHKGKGTKLCPGQVSSVTQGHSFTGAQFPNYRYD